MRERETERDRDRLGSSTPGKTPQEGGRGVFAKGTKQARTASVYYHLSFYNSLLNAVPTKHFNMCSLHLHEYPLSPPLLPYLLSHSNTPFTFPLSLFFTVVAQLPAKITSLWCRQKAPEAFIWLQPSWSVNCVLCGLLCLVCVGYMLFEKCLNHLNVNYKTKCAKMRMNNMLMLIIFFIILSL